MFFPRHHPDGLGWGVRTACKTSLRSSQDHAVLAHQPCSTPSWLWDSLRTSQGTAWLGGPGGGTCHTPVREVTGSALQRPFPSQRSMGEGSACWESGQHGASRDDPAPCLHPCCPSSVTAPTQSIPRHRRFARSATTAKPFRESTQHREGCFK